MLEKRKGRRHSVDIALLLIAIFWINKGEYLIALVLIAAAVAGFYINRKKYTIISTEHITYPFFIERNINWNEVSNMILKDDVLTIDLKNNKLLQSTISSDEASVDEMEFNSFCKQQLLNVQHLQPSSEKS